MRGAHCGAIDLIGGCGTNNQVGDDHIGVCCLREIGRDHGKKKRQPIGGDNRVGLSVGELGLGEERIIGNTVQIADGIHGTGDQIDVRITRGDQPSPDAKKISLAVWRYADVQRRRVGGIGRDGDQMKIQQVAIIVGQNINSQVSVAG